MGRSIIAAVDGSPESTNAARSAAVIAGMLGRRLVLAFAADDPAVFPAGDPRRHEIARHGAVSSAGALLSAVAEEIEAPDARKRIALSGGAFGGVAERLAGLALEEDADLVVVGARRRGVIGSLAHRSVSAALIENSSCPVMAVPSGAGLHEPLSAHPGVLFGVDGSADSDRAQLVAREFATALGTEMQPVSAEDDIASQPGAALLVVGARDHVDVASVARQLIRLSAVPVVVVSPEARIPRLAEPPVQPALVA